MRRTKLQMLMERDTEAFRKELLRYHKIATDEEWQANGVFYREYTFIVRGIEYAFTMCDGFVKSAKWSVVDA
jgi:hypothetical protein